MLHSLKIQNESQLHCNIWEIVKVNGNNQAIEFMQRNNCPGNIIVWPSCKTVERYPTELVKKQEAINFLLTTISNIVKCNTREAAECMLWSLYKQDEEAYISVALENGLIMDGKKKIDAVQVKAMLSEAGLTKNKYQNIIQAIASFLWKELLWIRTQEACFFAGTEFAPVIDRMNLEDKTIDFWFQEPDVMLKHQINSIIKQEELQRLILFWCHEAHSILKLFQIASVSHSKDDTKILFSTVLHPIGESLRRISLGGQFIVYDDSNDSLGLTFNLNVSYCVLSLSILLSFINLMSNH